MNGAVAAAPSVVVVGEALVDIVVRTDGTRTETPGGSPMNVAVALARLGVPTQLVTALGDDAHGDLVSAHLSRSGVVLAPGSRAPTRTSTAVARLRPDGSAAYDFDLAWDPCLPTLDSPTLVHAGSLALWLEPGADAVRRCLQHAAGAGALVTLDPNIRPAVLPAPDVVRERFDELARMAHVVKLSAEDASYLYPGLDPESVLDRVTSCGVRLVALTDESRGTLISSGRSTVTVRPPVVTVADTIGAGDTYMGALVHQLVTRRLVERVRDAQALSPDELVRICRFANRAAAVTVGRDGSDPPWLDELQERATGAVG
jgi:fructokinase